MVRFAVKAGMDLNLRMVRNLHHFYWCWSQPVILMLSQISMLQLHSLF